MTHDVLVAALAGALFVAFALGWLAGWLTLRAPRPLPGASAEITAARAEADAARRALAEALVEIDDLHALIDRPVAALADGLPER